MFNCSLLLLLLYRRRKIFGEEATEERSSKGGGNWEPLRQTSHNNLEPGHPTKIYSPRKLVGWGSRGADGCGAPLTAARERPAAVHRAHVNLQVPPIDRSIPLGRFFTCFEKSRAACRTLVLHEPVILGHDIVTNIPRWSRMLLDVELAGLISLTALLTRSERRSSPNHGICYTDDSKKYENQLLSLTGSS